MPFTVIDHVSLGSGRANEDRAGARGALAWVIDGATDVVDAPLTPGPSDAAWLAEALHRALERHADTGRADTGQADLAALVFDLATEMAEAFDAVRTRAPAGRGEHPSAAGIIARLSEGMLDYVSLGDCALIVARPGGTVVHHGLGAQGAGDAMLAAAISAFHKTQAKPSASAARRHIWPQVQAKRAAMNTPGGYGVLSITPPPRTLLFAGRIEVPPESRLMLMTDGLARLVDVFKTHTPDRLLEAAQRDGLADVAARLRAIEADDPECVTYPRAKTSDDATGLLLAIA